MCAQSDASPGVACFYLTVKTVTVKSCHVSVKTVRRFLRVWSDLLKKSLMENFFLCAVIDNQLP